MNYTILGIGVYLFLTLVIAWFFGRTKKNEDYLIANRNLGMWSSAMTIISSKIGAGFIIAIMAYVYLLGAIALFAFIGILAGYFAFIPFAKYLKREADKYKMYTLPEFYRHKFGFKVGFIMALLMFVTMEISVVTQLIGGAHIIADTTLLSYNWSVVAVAAVVLFYLILGGFRSVVATDFLQSLALLGLIPIFLFITIYVIGDIGAIDFTITDEGIRNIPNFLIIGFVLPFATPELWQRVYAVKDVETVGKTMFMTAILYSLFGLLLTLMALYFRGIVGEIVPETLLIAGFAKVLPSAFAVFGVIFILSAVMSSFDTYVFTASTVLVQDFINTKGREHSGGFAVWNLRLWQIVLIVAAVGIGLRVPNIVDTAIIVVGMYAVAGLVGIALFVRKEKLTNPFLPLLLGTVAIFYFMFTKGITPDVVSAGAVATALGLLINAVYSTFKKRKIKN